MLNLPIDYSLSVLPPETTTKVPWPTKVEWHSIVVFNTSSSYKVPQPFSLDYLRRLATAKRAEAEDGKCELHEDSCHLQEAFEARLQHRQEFYDDSIAQCPEAVPYVVSMAYRDLIVSVTLLADLEALQKLEDSVEVDAFTYQQLI